MERMRRVAEDAHSRSPAHAGGGEQILWRDAQAREAILFINNALRSQLHFMREYCIVLPKELAAYFQDHLVRDMVISSYQSHGWKIAAFYFDRRAFYLRRDTTAIPFSLPRA